MPKRFYEHNPNSRANDGPWCQPVRFPCFAGQESETVGQAGDGLSDILLGTGGTP